MLSSITRQLFSAQPVDTLYHYTSLNGLLGIINSGILRSSDIRYMNDSAELRHTLELMVNHITRRIVRGTDHPEVLNQLLEWLSHRIVSGPMLFGASFRANGNLLSQWRGYSLHGKGVSLGFDPQHISLCAGRAQFQVGRCLYDATIQETLIEDIVNTLELEVSQRAPSAAAQAEKIFEAIEGDLLRIAAILKHPSFEEEQEWRLVSPLITGQSSAPVHFREGASMLVPYYAFDLRDAATGSTPRDHVFVGPSANADLSMKSVELFLQQQNSAPRRGINYCQIPYRQR